VDRELDPGLLAVVRLSQPTSPHRYAIVSQAAFDDHVLARANLAALSYEREREADVSPTTILVYADGHLEATSAAHGPWSRDFKVMSRRKDPAARSADILKRARGVPPQAVPGFDNARIVPQHASP
jgi:hypothetical protein